jgi:predicted N-acetyltransferase YhbS
MTTGLTFRQDYFADSAAYKGLVDLLRDTFDIDISQQDRLGGPNPSSMPFGYFDVEGRCVANLSAFSMPLVINGKSVRAVGYQSGAVRPEHRRQGLYRDLMQRAFGWAAAQGFDLGILLTDKPALYQPCGFRSVQQYAFHGKAPKTSKAQRPARALSVENAADVDLIQRLLTRRQPVSDVFAVTTEAYFLLNACFDPEIRLGYLPDCDAVVAWKDSDGQVRLLDAVAAEIPPLAAIVAGLGLEQDTVTVCFPTDRIDWPAEAQPYLGDCDLMVTGMNDIPLPRAPFMLSPMAEF